MVPTPLYIVVLIVLGLVLTVFQYRMLFGGDNTESADTTDASSETGLTESADATDVSSGTGPTESADAINVSSETGLFARVVSALPALMGVALLAAGIAVWLQPALVPPALATAVEEIGDAPETPFLLLGGAIGATTLLVATFGSRANARKAVGNIGDPESIRRSTTQLTGEEIEAAVEGLGDADSQSSRGDREAATEHLRELVVESLTTHTGCTRSVARERVECGEWTDRGDVAAFVGGPEAPGVPVWHAFLDWASADPAYERRVRRTVAELDRVTRRGETP